MVSGKRVKSWDLCDHLNCILKIRLLAEPNLLKVNCGREMQLNLLFSKQQTIEGVETLRQSFTIFFYVDFCIVYDYTLFFFNYFQFRAIC